MGGDSIITNINYSSAACFVYDRDSIMQRKSMGGGRIFKRGFAVAFMLGWERLHRPSIWQWAQKSLTINATIYLP